MIYQLQARFFLVASLLLSTIGLKTLAQEKPDEIEFFESRIRPVLAQDCYACHNSRDEADGGLVLDHRDGLLKGGDRGQVIIPGKPDQSLLIQAIRHEIEDLEMPSAAPKLDQAIIRDFEQWVRMGAPDPRNAPPTDQELEADTQWPAIMERRKSWWSFQPISDAAPPEIAGASHPLDRFVRKRLLDAGLEPTQPAEKLVLVRRLTFALTGLPPTEKQLSEFLEQTDQQLAVNQLVDELLDSPHFGERWARHWMDWVRYAESHGSEGDPAIENAWLYRDYLIRALNQDVPYDQLLREHVAGDLLDEPRLNYELGINESLIGTAHWRMVFHGFAPTDALDEKVRFTDDQINVFTKAFLGLTVSCARCHNHKFDAISQADYYALFGILGSTRPGRKAIELPAKLSANTPKLAQLKSKIRTAVAEDWLSKIDDLDERLLNDQALWSKAGQPESPLNLLHTMQQVSNDPQLFAEAWQEQVKQWEEYQKARTEFESRDYPFRASFAEWFQEGVGLTGQPTKPGQFSIHPAGSQVIQGIYPAGVFSSLISTKLPARFTSPDFRLEGKNTLWLLVSGGGSAMARYVVQNYPRNGTVYPVKQFSANGKTAEQWVRFDVSYWAGDEIHIELSNARDAPLLTKPSNRSWFGISDAVLVPDGSPPPPSQRDYLKPIFATSKNKPPKSFEDLIAIYARAVKTSVEAWREQDIDDGTARFLNACIDDGVINNKIEEFGRAQTLIGAYRKIETDLPIPTRVPTLAEWRGQDQPLLDRGNHKTPLAPVSRRFLEAVDATPYQSQLSGRLELADDLLRKDNPFTRRVIVNRVWHHLFGRGIVSSPDNFGRMGEAPSHPEMLDYLANRFEADGWSIKKLIRLIVTSKTWQQDSVPSPIARRLDPNNQLLSHFNIQRLDAEAIRDSLLVGAGKLDSRLYGPPVNGTSSRRSVYVSVIRNRLDPFLSVFDAPVPFSTTGRRDVTTVPAQSLALFNDQFVINLAKTTAVDASKHDDFISSTWRRLLSRTPTSQEVLQSNQLLEALKEKYARNARRHTTVQTKIATLQQDLDTLRSQVRATILDSRANSDTEPQIDFRPIASWDFEQDLSDSIGSLHGKANGSARLENGALVLDGNGWVSTDAIASTLIEKTLQARVVLENLEQRGGGVMTVQSLDGASFDSIVYGEKSPRRWLAGSNFHRRTQPFNGSEETEAIERPVVITLVYQSDGTILAYRDGRPYGKQYRTGIETFTKGKCNIVFGLRHGTNAGGNRMLKGKILDATLYDRALKPDEVFASATSEANYVSESALLAAMTNEQRQSTTELTQAIRLLQAELTLLGEPVPVNQAYADLVLSIFNMKEFIYVR